MDRVGSHTGAVLRWTARIVVAVCAATVMVGGLAVAGGWWPVTAFGARVADDLFPPRPNGASADIVALSAAAERVSPRSVKSRVSIVQRPSRDRGSTAFDVTVTLSGTAADPFFTALRAGTGRAVPIQAVSLFAGVPTVAGLTPQFAAPTLWTDTDGLTAVVAGSVVVPTSGGAVPIAVTMPFLCDRVSARTVTTSLTDLSVAAATDGTDGCGVGTWPSQSATTVEYAGTAAVSVDAAPRATPQESAVVTRSSLFRADEPVGRVWRELLFALLTALPLLIAWRLVRGLGRLPAVAAAAAATGALLVFHIVVRVWLIAQNAVAGPLADLARPRLMFGLHPTYLPLYDTLTVALIVAMVFVWRRAALVATGGAGPLPSRPVWRLVGFLVLLAAVVAASVWGLNDQPWRDDWAGWLRAWPGLLVAGTGAAALVGAVSAALRRRFATSARGGPSPFLLTAVAAALVGLTQLIGHVATPGEYLVPNWLDWSTSPAGLVTLVLVFATTAGVLHLGHRLGRLAAAAVLLAVLAGALTLGLWATMLDQSRPGWVAALPEDQWQSSPGGVAVVAGAVVASAAAAALLVAALGGGPGLRGRAALAAGVAAVLLVIRPLVVVGGPLGPVLAAAVPVLAGAVVWKTLGRIGVEVLAALPAEQPLRPPGWSAFFGVGGLIAVLLSVPWSVHATSGWPVDWTDFGTLMLGIDACLPLFALALLVVVARLLGSPDADSGYSRGDHRSLRALGVAAAVAGLLTPTATAAGLPVSFLVGWLLLDVWLLPRAALPGGRVAVGDGPRQAAGRAVTDQAIAAAELRATAALERGLRKDLAAEGLSVAEREARLVKIRTLAPRIHPVSDAFATFAGETPWHRARAFGLIGLLAGLPWLLLDVGALFRDTDGAFRVVDAAAGALLLARFAVAGFVAGLTFPMIRGRTGLTKGLALFGALVVPALCATLLPDPAAGGVASAALLQTAQWLTFGLVIGLAADLRQLRASGLGWRSLSDVHNLTALTASFSSVVLAAVAATVTAIGTGAAGVVVERLVPPPAAATPAPAPAPSTGR